MHRDYEEAYIHRYKYTQLHVFNILCINYARSAFTFKIKLYTHTSIYHNKVIKSIRKI